MTQKSFKSIASSSNLVSEFKNIDFVIYVNIFVANLSRLSRHSIEKTKECNHVWNELIFLDNNVRFFLSLSYVLILVLSLSWFTVNKSDMVIILIWRIMLLVNFKKLFFNIKIT